MRTFVAYLGAVLLIVSFASCEYHQLAEPDPPQLCDTVRVTYADQIQSIIDSSCAYAGCHDGAGGIGPFDYTNYDGLANSFDDMRQRVIVLKDDPALGMPPNRSVYPQSQKDDLTPEELALFECWIEAGFPRD